jgi:hypothetical protein
MTLPTSFTTGDPVTVKCFSFQNPESINGPFGTFQLWIDGAEVGGQMTITTLFGLGSTTLLNLTGTISGTNPIVCALEGEGVFFSPGQLPLAVDEPVSISFASDFSTGQLSFSTDPFPGGLPVTETNCT